MNERGCRGFFTVGIFYLQGLNLSALLACLRASAGMLFRKRAHLANPTLEYPPSNEISAADGFFGG
ncbi:MAG: hypothetical protein WCJ66_11980 [Verrucomicrobiota bacterium]